MGDSWYGQKAAGFFEASPDDVMLLTRKPRTKNHRKDTQLYTEMVIKEIEEARGRGWDGWIAPECHNDDAGAADQWVWQWHNKEHLMEAKYMAGASLEELQFVCELHRGMGWRFPKLMVFDVKPQGKALAIMKACKVPWCIEEELRYNPQPPVPSFTMQDIYEQFAVVQDEVSKLGVMLDPGWDS